MDQPDLLKRDDPFSYTCHQCNRCCYGMLIQLNPYEVARLAQNRGMSTSAFLDQYTELRGTALKRDQTGACVFLTPEGCSVHPDRPLVCRIYPLGRHLGANGEESFSEISPLPQSEGVYGRVGTVGTFLEAQGAGPFMDAAERYLALLGRMVQTVRKTIKRDAPSRDAVVRKLTTPPGGADERIPEWLDMDSAVSAYCEEVGLEKPTDVSGKMQMHLRAIEVWLEDNQ